jgi:hypothetical protein
MEVELYAKRYRVLIRVPSEAHQRIPNMREIVRLNGEKRKMTVDIVSIIPHKQSLYSLE